MSLEPSLRDLELDLERAPRGNAIAFGGPVHPHWDGPLPSKARPAEHLPAQPQTSPGWLGRRLARCGVPGFWASVAGLAAAPLRLAAWALVRPGKAAMAALPVLFAAAVLHGAGAPRRDDEAIEMLLRARANVMAVSPADGGPNCTLHPPQLMGAHYALDPRVTRRPDGKLTMEALPYEEGYLGCEMIFAAEPGSPVSFQWR
ncbi:MAG: hypothetical protein IT463_10995 [Planctomycetes bacterium]|nr:hypothetical protein [Planctomycetota bacterium]